jgi:hypothetical protein
MKNKNDFEPESEPDVIQPIACVYCQHKEMERVRVHGIYGNLINRLSDFKLFHNLAPGFAKSYPTYGWRCMNCGYIMWFTARTLD